MKASGRKSGYLASAESAGKAWMAETSLNSHGESRGEAVPSSTGDSKGHVQESDRPLLLQCRDCEAVVHELSNVMTGVLLNAQVLEWKLPPYSHLKRSVREVERNAQRGSELLKRLQRRLMHAEAETQGSAAPEQGRQSLDTASTNLTNDCEPRTSGFFPKRDDGREG